MEKQIRSDLIKMIAIMLVMVGLGIYAHDFVIKGIMAKAALNLSIFALFGLAAWFAFRHVLKLKNEVVALKALQVDYGARERRPFDPYRHPAIVFDEPELLGHGYSLIAEEVSKNNNFQISNATVQTILHDVDMRINDRKSTLMYFSGLMVFLGLLGAFMGLMKTVGSVGDLIGGMDVSGGGGSDSFGVLIEGMKGPLNGMSVGFSSSLFGLMTSMVLGALERCMSSAMKALRNEFEHWLSNVSALEAPQNEGGQRDAAELGNVIRALELGGKHLRDMRETVLDGAMAQEQTQRAVAEMTQSIASLGASVEKLNDPSPMLKPIADCVAELARNQTLMVGQFHGLIHEAQRDRDAIRDALERMQRVVDAQSSLNGPQLHAQIDRMTALQAELLTKEPAAVTISHYGGGGGAASGGLMARIGGLFGRGTGESGETRRERKRLRSEIRRMLVAQRRMTRKVERSLGGSIDRLEAGRTHDNQLIARLTAQNEANNARLAILMDRLQIIDERKAGSADDLHLMDGMHGARREMEVLKHRLDLLQEAEGMEPEKAAPVNGYRMTGTADAAAQ
tara:strand:+ start:58048 stop:59745 length:1698 start_codon:yes stop_codon:yes gene_type:complete